MIHMDARLIYWGVPAQPNKSGIGNIYLNALNLKSKELTHKHQHQDTWLPMPIPRTMRKFPPWSPGALQRQGCGMLVWEHQDATVIDLLELQEMSASQAMSGYVRLKDRRGGTWNQAWPTEVSPACPLISTAPVNKGDSFCCNRFTSRDRAET